MNRRGEVLEALRAAGERGLSGEALASGLGVTRAAIAKHVAALRALGYRIDAATGAGYRFGGAPDALLPVEVERALRSSRWTRLEGGGPTGSSNDDAKRLARDGAPDGTVVLASAQSEGRGRLGRTWTSPPGGVYLSFILRPLLAAAETPPLALAIGLGVAEGLDRFGVRTLVKWPNDVMLGAGKLAGVLLELSAESDRVEWVAAGVGANVRRSAGAGAGRALGPGGSGEADRPAEWGGVAPAYLDDAAPGIPLADVAAAVLDGIAAALADFESGGFAALHARYSSRDALAGRAIAASDALGRLIAAGEVEGVDRAGRLSVRTPEGTVVSVSSGEVTLRG